MDETGMTPSILIGVRDPYSVHVIHKHTARKYSLWIHAFLEIQNKQDRGCYVNRMVSKTSLGSIIEQRPAIRSQEDNGERTGQADREVGGGLEPPRTGREARVADAQK